MNIQSWQMWLKFQRRVEAACGMKIQVTQNRVQRLRSADRCSVVIFGKGSWQAWRNLEGIWVISGRGHMGDCSFVDLIEFVHRYFE